MFGRSPPVVFASYGGRRSRWRLPRWLVLLLSGTVLGAGGVIVVQERYLPPRLTASDSAALRQAYEQADVERQRLKLDLAGTQQRLAIALVEQKSAVNELATGRAATERMRADLAMVVAALPPDPRGGAVEVRAGRLTAQGGMLAYDVVLTRERTSGKPLPGVLQLVVAGESERGTPSTVALKAIAVSVGSHEVVRGSQALPAGFRPRQTTIQVLDRGAGQSLGMRVLPVK